MPFQSEKQKKWMWANKPEMAREWTSKYGSKIEAKKGTMAKKDKNWIQKATKNMRKDKPCTGKKFGGPTCPPGSKRYNLAKTFRKMNKAATGTMVKADSGKWIIKQKEQPARPWITKKKKADSMADTEHMRTKKQWWIKKKKITGDEAKGGSFTPGYKPHLSVRTAKKGTFSSIDTDRILAQMKVRHAGGLPKATKYKKYLKSLGKATSSKFPANAFTAGKTALGAAQLKAHLKTKLPTAKVGIAKKLLRKTGFGKALAVATAAGAGYEAGKRGLLKLKNKKVQKKATGGEIIIGRGVDIDLL